MISLRSQRCPKCGKRCRSKERCRSCGYKLLFLKSAISESEWQAAVNRVSVNDSLFYTSKQLFGEFLYEFLPRFPLYGWILAFYVLASFLTLPWTVALVLALGLTVAVFLPSALRIFPLYFVLLSPLILAFVFSVRWSLLFFTPALLFATYSLSYKPPPKLSFAEFEALLTTWLEGNRQSRLILRTRLDRIPKQHSAEDLLAFGHRAVLIVDQDCLVDFLVLNRFCFQHPVLILSHNFYPAHIGASIARKIPVYYLHGTAHNIDFLHGHLKKNRFPFSEIVSIGWTSEQLKKHPNFQNFENWDNIPVDLLSPVELLDSVSYAMLHRTSLLSYFEEVT